MSGATFSRIKNWAPEVLTNTDLNAEIDNILNNLGPAGVDDYSSNATQMRIQADPGTQGSESLATSLAGEIERLRFVIQRILGNATTEWYDPPPGTLTNLVASIGSGLPPNRIVSGVTNGQSSQLAALVPNGASASLTLAGNATPFNYYINGTAAAVTAAVTITGLSLAAANNTCTINNTAAAGNSAWTRFAGMYGTQIPVANMATGISTLIGQTAAFKVGSEYFTAFVESTSSLTNAWRGPFYDSTLTEINSVTFNTADTVTLQRLTWVFANANGSLAVTYNNPYVSGIQPTSPSTGDYWLDLSTTAWKTFTSTSWVTASATLVGMCVQNTAATVAARTFDRYVLPSSTNTCEVELNSITQVQAKDAYGEVNVFGTSLKFLAAKPIWDITQNLQSGLTESASTVYYLYLKESGVQIVSDRPPINRKDLRGLYHPQNTWRCVGSAFNDATSNLVAPVRSFFGDEKDTIYMGSWRAYNNYDVGILANSTGSVAYPTNASRFIVRHWDQAIIQTVSATTGSWTSVETLSLTPGLWRLLGSANVYYNSTAGATTLVSLAIDPNTTPTVSIFPYNRASAQIQGVTPSVGGAQVGLFIPSYYVNITAAAVYKLSMRIDTNTANLNYDWLMQAERIDALTGMPS